MNAQRRHLACIVIAADADFKPVPHFFDGLLAFVRQAANGNQRANGWKAIKNHRHAAKNGERIRCSLDRP